MEREKEAWIEKAMNSLEGIQGALPSAGLQSRVLQRIRAERFSIVRDAVRPATIYRAAAAIAFIVGLNILTCVIFQKNISEKKGLTSIAKEYSLGDSSSDGLINI